MNICRAVITSDNVNYVQERLCESKYHTGIVVTVTFIITPYLCTLAPAPPMIASTSFLLAMVVSPGVVIANAP